MIRDLLERRRAHVLGVSCAAGLAAATGLRAETPLVVVAAVAAAASTAVVVREPARLALLAAALALSGWWWGSARLDAIDHSVLAQEVGVYGDALAVVTAPARRSPYEVRVAARVLRFRGRDVSEAVQLELPPARAPPQGAVLSLFAEIVEPEHDEDFDERTFLRRRGVHVILRARGWRIVGARGGVGGVADRLRRALVRGLDGLTGERRAVLAGVVLGEDEGLSEGLRDAFRTSGLYHLLAVSGQNVALLAAGVFLLGWLVRLPRLAIELTILAAIGGYVLAVGWQPSVVRAGVAGALASIAWLTARERDPWWLLVAGAVVLLAWNPYSLLEPGFQLSFAAVAAIFGGAPWLVRRLEGYPVPRWLALVVAISTACGVATAPILWLHFGAVPLYSVLANALAAPIVGFLLGLALVAGLLVPISPSAAFALAWIDGWLAAYLVWCARIVARLPFARLTSGRVLLALVAAVGFAWIVRRLPAPRPLRALVLLGMAAVALVAWSSRKAAEPPPPPNGLRVTFLDVGQGDGTLVEAPGVRLLVDQGPPEARVADELRRMGVQTLTALVLTHPQRDHVGGAAEVLRKLRVGFVLDPRLPTSGPEERSAMAEARRDGVRVVAARAGRAFRLGPLRVAILWPDGPGFPGEDPNQRAIVLVVTYGRVDVLLTADAESDVTLPLSPPPVEVMKVAHHGSADDGLGELLHLTSPEVAVISVGLGNDYGHPTPSTLHALEREPGLRLFRTDLDGRVVVESDGTRIWVRSER
ncbi:MAG TPA: DNA internalization-related competence protein ComEC/Rec2 [Gaiellaceae bacterium]|nr:DNA internalization-related competence protein ComEC/Rec2 [Gaiellaceae bacterium]